MGTTTSSRKTNPNLGYGQARAEGFDIKGKDAGTRSPGNKQKKKKKKKSGGSSTSTTTTTPVKEPYGASPVPGATKDLPAGFVSSMTSEGPIRHASDTQAPKANRIPGIDDRPELADPQQEVPPDAGLPVPDSTYGHPIPEEDASKPPEVPEVERDEGEPEGPSVLEQMQDQWSTIKAEGEAMLESMLGGVGQAQSQLARRGIEAGAQFQGGSGAAEAAALQGGLEGVRLEADIRKQARQEQMNREMTWLGMSADLAEAEENRDLQKWLQEQQNDLLREQMELEYGDVPTTQSYEAQEKMFDLDRDLMSEMERGQYLSDYGHMQFNMDKGRADEVGQWLSRHQDHFDLFKFGGVKTITGDEQKAIMQWMAEHPNVLPGALGQDDLWLKIIEGKV
jgi:hypothetical protein